MALCPLSATLALVLAAAPAPKNEDCLACHEDRDLKSSAGASLYVDATRAKQGVHGDFACVDCHSGMAELPHAERLPKVDCAACHDDVAKQYAASVHGTARANGTVDAATCRSCHGPAHEIVPRSDPASTVAKQSLADTCGACHANPEFLSRHKIPFAKPVEAYRLSVHGRALARGDTNAASCSDCHGSHGIQPGRSVAAKTNHWRVVETCGACHKEIAATFAESVHGAAVRAGVDGAPVCTDCHGEHSILAPSEPGSLVNPARVSSVTCGRCHGDERLAARYNLPKDKVPAFEDSYHGLALRAGSQTVANCASCHGVHNILPASDPRSTVHPSQVAKTCGSCHPGAGGRFALGPVHVRSATASEHPVVRWIRVAYWILIPLTIGGMLLHNALDFLRKLLRGPAGHHGGETVERMNLHFRIAHFIVVFSFPTLVVTGFALKFPEAWWARPLLTWEAELAFRGLVHRAAGVVLILALVYHAVHLALVPRDRAILRQLLPRARDLADAWGMMLFNAGRSLSRPLFGQFSYAEKAEYWAFIWGTIVMGASGLLLWFNNFTLARWPKWVSDAATALHYYEAILATLAILIWHFYMVVFDPDVYPMDKAWLTGRASAEHLRTTRAWYRPRPAAPAGTPAEPPKVDPEKPEVGRPESADTKVAPPPRKEE
jgi:cytochrome b subunit of formate dehydrogenase